MKSCLFICAILLFFAQAARAAELRFVLDLDHVLWHKIEPSKTAGIPDSELLRHGDWAYRVRDGAREFIEALSRRGEVTYFSAGPENRNLSLLAQLKMTNGKSSALEVAKRRVFSEHHLTADKKKDLLKAVSADELPHTLLIDDTATNALETQKGNLIWAENTWKKDSFVESFEHAKLQTNNTRQARDLASDFTTDRNKLVRIMGQIDLGIQVSKNTGLPLSRVVHGQGARSQFRTAGELRMLRRGALAFKEVNPKYHLTTLLPNYTPIGCIREQLGMAPLNFVPDFAAVVAMGYLPENARSIAQRYPAIAQRILEESAEPLTLYRGLKVENSGFDPKLSPGSFRAPDGSFKQLTYFGSQETALSYALNSKVNNPTIIEAQIPEFLNFATDTEFFALSHSEIPDISPFITRIGSIERANGEEQVRWKPNPYIFLRKQ